MALASTSSRLTCKRRRWRSLRSTCVSSVASTVRWHQRGRLTRAREAPWPPCASLAASKRHVVWPSRHCLPATTRLHDAHSARPPLGGRGPCAPTTLPPMRTTRGHTRDRCSLRDEQSSRPPAHVRQGRTRSCLRRGSAPCRVAAPPDRPPLRSREVVPAARLRLRPAPTRHQQAPLLATPPLARGAVAGARLVALPRSV